MPRVEPDVVAPTARHDRFDLAAHHIARRQFGERVHAEHEALLRAVEEVGPLPTERLGDQEPRCRIVVERGGMELHELKVSDACPRPPCGREPVSGSDGGVGGDAVCLTGAARRKHDRVRPEDLASARRRVDHERADAPVVVP